MYHEHGVGSDAKMEAHSKETGHQLITTHRGSKFTLERMLSRFHIIVVISNPVRFKSRYTLFENFKKHVQCSGGNLWTVETAFGDRPFAVTNATKQDIRFRTFDEIWHKENMINLALARLPEDWEYVAWIDADVMFTNPNWVEETVQQLQHYMVVQMFSYAQDLGPRGEPMQLHQGFVSRYIQLGCKNPNPTGYASYYGSASPRGNMAHPGYAWAARREALEHLGGLIDFAIMGSGDHNMAMALIGEVTNTFPSGMHSRYALKMLQWQDRAEKYIRRDIGCLDGTISHYWHGKKTDRGYVSRWKILLENNYDPDLDIKRDTQGLWVWTDHNHKLRDAVRAYFRQRNEDSIDL